VGVGGGRVVYACYWQFFQLYTISHMKYINENLLLHTFHVPKYTFRFFSTKIQQPRTQQK
jgi:hypothetical protein